MEVDELRILLVCPLPSPIFIIFTFMLICHSSKGIGLEKGEERKEEPFILIHVGQFIGLSSFNLNTPWKSLLSIEQIKFGRMRNKSLYCSKLNNSLLEAIEII